jgi:predicted DNA-binding transcriptional regulator AlpA
VSEEQELMTHIELAEMLRMKPASVLHRLYHRPETLPKRIKLPGTRGVFFLRSDVVKLLRQAYGKTVA